MREETQFVSGDAHKRPCQRIISRRGDESRTWGTTTPHYHERYHATMVKFTTPLIRGFKHYNNNNSKENTHLRQSHYIDGWTQTK